MSPIFSFFKLLVPVEGHSEGSVRGLARLLNRDYLLVNRQLISSNKFKGSQFCPSKTIKTVIFKGLAFIFANPFLIGFAGYIIEVVDFLEQPIIVK